MLDFTDGTTWFLAGLAITAFVAALVVVFVVFARRVEQR